MYPILRPFLNKGGAGRSMTREESIDALNPVVHRHAELLLAYGAAIRDLSDRGLAEALDGVMNRARTELAKLKESVFALGGTPPNSTDLDPAAVRLGRDDAEILHALDDRERAYRDALSDTIGLPHHQIRTTAILENNLKGSEARIGVLHPMVTRMRRPSSTPAMDRDERHATPLERGNIHEVTE